MTTNTQFVHKSIGSKTLGLLFLLSLSVFINYVDRGNLSVAAPLLKGELNLSASQLGVLLGAFFWTYMALMIVSGWLVDRFHVGWVLAVGFAVWSLATGLTGLVHGFTTLLICRMLLGAGESVAFPSYGKILARHVGQEQRGLANAIITCGMTRHLCLNYPLYLMIVWLPYYLVNERHLSMKQMAEEGALFYLIYAIASPILASIADHLIRTGMSANVVRKLSMAVGHIVVAAGLLGCAAGSARISFISLMIMGAACGFAGPNTFVFAQTFAGPAVAGRWTGLQNCFANLAGVVVAPLTGLVVDRTGQFWWAFVVAAAITLLGGAFWVFLTGPLRQLQWPSEIQDTKVPLMNPVVSPT